MRGAKAQRCKGVAAYMDAERAYTHRASTYRGPTALFGMVLEILHEGLLQLVVFNTPHIHCLQAPRVFGRLKKVMKERAPKVWNGRLASRAKQFTTANSQRLVGEFLPTLLWRNVRLSRPRLPSFATPTHRGNFLQRELAIALMRGHVGQVA